MVVVMVGFFIERSMDVFVDGVKQQWFWLRWWLLLSWLFLFKRYMGLKECPGLFMCHFFHRPKRWQWW